MTDAQFHADRIAAERAADIAAHAAYIRECGGEPYAVYRCDRIKRGQAPTGEVAVAVRASAGEAMAAANACKRADPAHSYVVGAA